MPTKEKIIMSVLAALSVSFGLQAQQMRDIVIDLRSVTQSNDLAQALSEAKSYTDRKEFSKTEYFVVTNPPIDVADASITNSFEEAFQGMAFDLYFTNSIYFVDENTVPTLKFFAPKRRRAYFGNRISCVEIGDEYQVFRTHNQQVDNMLAVRTPQHIRFSDTLDRNAPYDQGRSMTLQDYLDAFNPVLVPETIRMFQTNNSDFAMGNLDVNGAFNIYGISSRTKQWQEVYRNVDGGSAHPLVFNFARTTISTNKIFSVSPFGVDMFGAVSVLPSTKNDVEIQTNSIGQVTNWDSYIPSNANVKVEGIVDIGGDLMAKNLVAEKGIEVYGFDKITSRQYVTYDKEGNATIITDPTNSLHFSRMTLADHLNMVARPLIIATNEYHVGDKVLEVHKNLRMSDSGTRIVQSNGHGTMTLKMLNKRSFHYDGAMCDTTPLGRPAQTITNVVVTLPSPANYDGDSEHLKTEITFDLSACSHSVTLDFGRNNFTNIVDSESMSYGGQWETVLSTVEPDIAVESVLRTSTETTYEWIQDPTTGEWVEDTANPITATLEWYDNYMTDMNFTIEPYSCKQFKFTQVGERTMKVEIQDLYKTVPTGAAVNY